MDILKVFIGYDSREPVAYHVAAHSIMRRASKPVAIIPLIQSQLRRDQLYARPIDTKAATEFSLTRFLVPYLSRYEGYSVFIDCDVVVRCDIYDLLREIERTHAMMEPPADVYICPHDYTPKDAVKMDGQVQAAYPRKNWSSMMVFDNARCGALSPYLVHTLSPADLHRLRWANLYGELPLEYNWLVGEYPPNPDAKILHYTNGGPWFRDHAQCDHWRDWLDEYNAATSPPLNNSSREAWLEFAERTRG